MHDEERRPIEEGAYCPVCKRAGLGLARFGNTWKCRCCGSKIPDRAYFEFICSALAQIEERQRGRAKC